MAFQVSPGVIVQEQDLSTIIPAVATTPAGIAGHFQWGPVDQRILIDSENNLVQLFGTPDNNTYEYFFTASNFLQYGNNLQVVRVLGTSSINAGAGPTSGNTSFLVRNSDHYDNLTTNGTVENSVAITNKVHFAAKYPGSLGNSLQIQLCDGTAAFSSWGLSSQFSGAPTTTDFAANYGGTYDEIHIAVIDQDGKFSGTTGTVLEVYEGLSKATDARAEDGSSNYYAEVLNTQSKYIWWLSHPSGIFAHSAVDGGSYGQINAPTNPYGIGGSTGPTGGMSLSFTGGNITVPTSGQIATPIGASSGYGLFSDVDFVNVSFLLAGPINDSNASNISAIAKSRKDAIAFLSANNKIAMDDNTTKVNNCLSLKNTVGNNNYAFIDSGYKYQYDRYNDKYRWVPLNGDVAGLCARTDLTNDPWFSPAGFNRGTINGVIKLAFNPSQANRDIIYPQGINPVVTIPGQGTVLFGDRTAQTKPSAFDRINVRRLFIVLEKAISIAAKYQLFEFNDATTRALFVATVEPYLRDVQSRRGIYDFKVVCDETNNTPEVIDSNQFVASIFIKPAKSINFINLSFIATRTGVSFEEITALNSPS